MRVPALGFRFGPVVCLALPLIVLFPGVTGAADQKPPAAPEKRVAAATCVTGTASLLRREAPDKPWQLVKAVTAPC